MALCGWCREHKPESEFYRRSGNRSGELASGCKSCRRSRCDTSSRDATRYERNAAIIVAAKSVPCARCGESHPPRVMDLHHRDPELKDKQWGHRAGWTEQRLRSEIAKCDVLCANCHRYLHGE